MKTESTEPRPNDANAKFTEALGLSASCKHRVDRQFNTAKHIQRNGSFAEAVQAGRGNLVYLVRAKEKPSNRDAWYFVQLRTAVQVPVFVELVKTGLDLSEWGTVLYSGWGNEPGEDVREMIRKRFG